MPVPDTEALQKILRELMVIVQEIRAFVPSNGTRPDTPKAPAPGNVITLPPRKNVGPNNMLFPHPPGSAKNCAICGINMANVVFWPCMHCVICPDCWKNYYALSSKDGRTSAFVRQDSWGCPAKACTIKIQKAYSLSQYTDAKREDEVMYSQKNEYLGESAAEV